VTLKVINSQIFGIATGCDFDYEEDIPEFDITSVTKSDVFHKVEYLVATDGQRFKDFQCDDDIVPETDKRTSSVSSRVSGDTETPCLSTNVTIVPTELMNTNKVKRQIDNGGPVLLAIMFNKCS
jgi:hypothetical protein